MSVNPSRGHGPNAHPLLQSEIEHAQRETRSGAEAARYLNVNYDTYAKYAKLYGIFDHHKNKRGWGMAKLRIRGQHGLQAIFDGKHPTYDRTKLKERVIAAGYLEAKCALCDFAECRVLDGRAPLMLHFKDGNPRNMALDNLEIRCYNCTYLTTGKISGPKVHPAVLNEDLLLHGDINMDDITRLQDELFSLTDSNHE